MPGVVVAREGSVVGARVGELVDVVEAARTDSIKAWICRFRERCEGSREVGFAGRARSVRLELACPCEVEWRVEVLVVTEPRACELAPELVPSGDELRTVGKLAFNRSMAYLMRPFKMWSRISVRSKRASTSAHCALVWHQKLRSGAAQADTCDVWRTAALSTKQARRLLKEAISPDGSKAVCLAAHPQSKPQSKCAAWSRTHLSVIGPYANPGPRAPGQYLHPARLCHGHLSAL